MNDYRLPPCARPVLSIEATGRGSDYFGPCDCCGKPMSEAFKLMRGHARASHPGTVYQPDAVAYGHAACVEARVRRAAA